MSNYTRIVNYAAKDSLPTGNAGKVIKGTEIEAELDAIAVAVATKFDNTVTTLTSPIILGLMTGSGTIDGGTF